MRSPLCSNRDYFHIYCSVWHIINALHILANLFLKTTPGSMFITPFADEETETCSLNDLPKVRGSAGYSNPNTDPREQKLSVLKDLLLCLSLPLEHSYCQYRLMVS